MNVILFINLYLLINLQKIKKTEFEVFFKFFLMNFLSFQYTTCFKLEI